MPAYCLFDNIRVDDPRKLEEYKMAAAPLVEKYGGRYAVIGGTVERKEGGWAPVFPVLIEFPSLRRAQEWYDSAEYAPLKALRQSAGSFNAVFFEGLPPPPAAPRLAGSVRFEEATPRPSGAEEAV